MLMVTNATVPIPETFGREKHVINTHDGTRIPTTLGAIVGLDLSDVPSAEAVRARSAYAALPDVRLDRVLEMRRRLANGLFQPSAEELADAILSAAARSIPCR